MRPAPIIGTLPELSHPDGAWCTIGDNFSALRREIRKRHGADLVEHVSGDDRVSRMVLGPSFGRGYLEFLSLGDDISVIISDGCFNNAQPFKLFGQEWLRFHFRLSGQNSLLFGEEVQFDLTGPLAQLLLLPPDMPHTDYIGGHGMQMVSIYCSRRTLIDVLGIDPGHLPGALERYMGNDQLTFQLDHVRYSRDVQDALTTLFRSSVSAGMRPAYVKMKVLEILCLFISDLQETRGAGDASLTLRERERLREVHDSILRSPGDAWRIPDLSRLAGMNRNKLTRGFREMYGISIFEHHQRARLNLAAQLLGEGGRSISQVAFDVGYAHQSTFTSVFHKEFGVSPARYQKTRIPHK